MILRLLELARPRHWVKSVFIWLPVPFAIASGAQADWMRLAIGTLGFCLVTSAVYVMNDFADRQRDAAHPTKRRRPLASGSVPGGVALAWGLALAVAGFALVGSVGVVAALRYTGVYVALNVAYSVGAKNQPLLDVFLLAAGYVVRVLLGCALVGAPPSSWLLLCASSLALFLAFAKRRTDVIAGLEGNHRPSLAGYNEGFLSSAMTVTAAIALVSYGLYCQDGEHLMPGRELASLPFVAFGLLEYLRLAWVEGKGGSPVDLLIASPVLLLCGAGWLVSVLWGLGMI